MDEGRAAETGGCPVLCVARQLVSFKLCATLMTHSTRSHIKSWAKRNAGVCLRTYSRWQLVNGFLWEPFLLLRLWDGKWQKRPTWNTINPELVSLMMHQMDLTKITDWSRKIEKLNWRINASKWNWFGNNADNGVQLKCISVVHLILIFFSFQLCYALSEKNPSARGKKWSEWENK